MTGNTLEVQGWTFCSLLHLATSSPEPASLKHVLHVVGFAAATIKIKGKHLDINMKIPGVSNFRIILISAAFSRLVFVLPQAEGARAPRDGLRASAVPAKTAAYKDLNCLKSSTFKPEVKTVK